MDGITPLATMADYEARHGAVSDRDRVEALLTDASALVLARMGGYELGRDAVLDANVVAVVCGVVARALCAPEGMEGVSQATQTGGPYSMSVSYANATGDLYLTRSDERRLGIGRARIWSIEPMTGRDREGEP